MLKMCCDSIYKPLEMIFRRALLTGLFLSEWNKGSIVPVHKKNDKKNFKNYPLVSLLPICGKIFEILIFNEMCRLFISNNLISQKMLGFKPGDSCLKQLLLITHEIYQSYDDGLEVRGVFFRYIQSFQ